MKNFTHTIIKYTIWALIFMGSTYAYAVGTWSEPTGTAPNGNTDAPLNLGSTAQNKTGALGATQFCDSVGANCLSTTQIISTSSTSQTKSGFLWAGGFGSTAGGYFATTLGVATTTDPATKGLKALFNGNVGASAYCDANGANCITPSTVSKIKSISNAYGGAGSTAIPYTHQVKVTGEIGNFYKITGAQLTTLLGSYGITETRPIRRLIVKTSLSFSGTTNVSGKYYYAQIGNTDATTYYESGIPIYSTPFWYVSSSGATTGDLEMTNQIDRNGSSGEFSMYCKVKSYNAVAIGATGALTCNNYIIGYITD